MSQSEILRLAELAKQAAIGHWISEKTGRVCDRCGEIIEGCEQEVYHRSND